jgi:hypothetical protein
MVSKYADNKHETMYLSLLNLVIHIPKPITEYLIESYIYMV